MLVAASAAAQGVTLTRGPYLQSTTRDSTIVVWQTDLPGDSVVEYGESGYTQVVADSTLVATHVVTLTGLTPATTYQYQIKTNGVVLRQSTLATAPNPGGEFSFVVIGDSGTGSAEQYAVAGRMIALAPDFMLHTGDVIYQFGQASGYDPFFFEPYADLLDHVPVFPSLGNHDYGTPDAQPYLDAFYLPTNNPAGTERYYSFDWGEAHFAVLDTTPPRYADAAMLQWLDADLTASGAQWQFVYFHHAIYSSGPHGFELIILQMRDTLAPIFEQHDVDIVFSGHDHDYERTTPRRDYAPESKGVVYVVSGGGGASVYPVLPQDFTAVAVSAHHAVQVRIDGCILSLRAVDAGGAVLDAIALAKCPHNVYLPLILKRN